MGEMNKAGTLRRLAAIVKKRRKERGWSQRDLAERTGTNRDVIKRLEKGENDARCSVVFRVLPMLGCTSEDLQQIIGMKRVA